jgi:hypothetical protein
MEESVEGNLRSKQSEPRGSPWRSSGQLSIVQQSSLVSDALSGVLM